MTSGRRLVHGRLGDGSVRVAQKQEVEGLLLGGGAVHREVAEVEVACVDR